MDLKTRLRETISAGSLQELEERWMEALDVAEGNEAPDLDALVEAADAFLDASLPDKADVLIELTLPLYDSDTDPARLLGLLRRACIAAPVKASLRERFVECFRQAHGVSSVEVVYLELAEVVRVTDVRKAFSTLDRWMSFKESSHVHHESGWGTGRITAIDPLMRRVTVDLERRANHTMDIEAMGSVLEPLDENHFLALQYDGGERLKEMAQSEPVALIETVLRSFRNPMNLKEIKLRLVPEIISGQDWTRWWGRAKKFLRETGFFRVGERAPYRVERVEEAISYEDELVAAFLAGTWHARRALARKVLRDGKKYSNLQEVIFEELEKVIVGGPVSRGLEAAYLLDRFRGPPSSAAPSSVPEGQFRAAALLRDCDDHVAAVLGVSGGDEQAHAASLLPEILGERWPAAALTLLERAEDATRDALVGLCEGTPLADQVGSRIDAALDNPRPFPDLFIWAVRRSRQEKPRPGKSVDELDVREFCDRVLDLFSQLNLRAERDEDPAACESLAALRALVQQKSMALLRTMFGRLETSDGRAIYERLRDHTGLSRPLRIDLLDVLVKTHPEVSRPIDVPVWEEAVIYVTPQGRNRHEDALRELMEETLPAIFEDIGRAAAFGDLSENAEYKAAMEKRDIFTARGEKMRAELDQVSLITPTMLRDGEVTLGAKVSVRDIDTGQKHVYRILGPWDGNPDDGVISYKSPVGRGFLGTHVGDTVTAELPGRKQNFEVLNVESGLEESTET